MKNILTYLFCFFLFVSCESGNSRTNAEQNSFCYWNTLFYFSGRDYELQKEMDVNHLYLRYFDVGWDPIVKEPKPISTVEYRYGTIPNVHVTPSIFLKNRVFEASSRNQLDTLCERIIRRIEQVNTSFSNTSKKNNTAVSDDLEEKHLGLNYSDILIDCDWTESTKEKFFYFVKQLQSRIPDKDITTTLRLWQYKNKEVAGIPPVKNVLLMCYNLEAANNPSVENSIISLPELKKYIHNVTYPLHIDVALPIFNWAVIFRNNEFKAVISQQQLDDYRYNSNFQDLGNNKFRVLKEDVIGDFFLRVGDEIRLEILTKEQLKSLSSYILSEVKTDNKSRITFFSMDNNYINNYGTDEIKDIYTHRF